MSGAQTSPAGEAEATCWAGMLDIYSCFLKGAGPMKRQDSYLEMGVTLWDATQVGLRFGQAGLDRMRAKRAPDALKPEAIVARDEVVTRFGDVVVCRHFIDASYRDQSDRMIRATVVWALAGSQWQIVHSHNDLFPVAAYTVTDADPIPADAVPDGPCAERLEAQRRIYGHALARDPVSLDYYLTPDITVWDAWQEPMFFGHNGLAEMRSHRDSDTQPVTELVIENPVYRQIGGVVLARHVLVCRYAHRVDEQMRCTILWQRSGDGWKIVHSHEDLLPEPPAGEAAANA